MNKIEVYKKLLYILRFIQRNIHSFCKAHKRLIYIFILILIISCTLDNIKTAGGRNSIDNSAPSNKINSEIKKSFTDDPNKIFINRYNDKDDDEKNKKKRPATITAVGDVVLNIEYMGGMLYRRTNKYGRKKAMAYPFSKVKDAIIGIGFCNLEAPITDLEFNYFSDKDEEFYFRSPGGTEDILKYGGFKAVSLANNHIMDAGEAGMVDTYKNLKKVDIIPVGVGNNIYDALRPVYINDKGTVVAIYAFSTVIPKSVWAGPDKAGTAGGSGELLCAAIKKARHKKADAVFVSIHWGEEAFADYPVEEPEREQIELAHKLIDAGASCIVGHHSHALGYVERYKDGIIFYSLGDLIFAGRYTESHATSIIAQISLSSLGLESYTLIPVNNNPFEVGYSPKILDEKNGRGVINRILRDNKDSKYADYYKKNSKK
jgi:poly-gamma-glutamate synthesis protein (capsule biosynthesis protein)